MCVFVFEQQVLLKFEIKNTPEGVAVIQIRNSKNWWKTFFIYQEIDFLKEKGNIYYKSLKMESAYNEILSQSEMLHSAIWKNTIQLHLVTQK